MIEPQGPDLLQKLMNDGPPVLVVLLIFVALQALVMGRQHPLLGAVIVAVGVLAAAVVDLLTTWRTIGSGDDAGRQAFWMRPDKS